MERKDMHKIIGYKLLKLLLEESRKSEKLEPSVLYYGVIKEKIDLLEYVELFKREINPIIKNQLDLLLNNNNAIPKHVGKFDEEEVRAFKYKLKNFQRVHNEWFYFYKRLIEEDKREHCIVRHVSILDIGKLLSMVNKVISLLYLVLEINASYKTISEDKYNRYLKRLFQIDRMYERLKEEVNEDVVSLYETLENDTL